MVSIENSRKFVQKIMAIWCIALFVCLFLVFIIAKYSILEIDNKFTLFFYSLPFHVGILLTLLLAYMKLFKNEYQNMIFSFLIKALFFLFVVAYFVVITLFVWFFFIT